MNFIKYKATFLLILYIFIINSTLCIATDRYVSKTGNSELPYLTWQTAADSIKKCINIFGFGDINNLENIMFDLKLRVDYEV